MLSIARRAHARDPDLQPGPHPDRARARRPPRHRAHRRRPHDGPDDLDAAALAAKEPGLATLSPPLARQLARVELVARSSEAVLIGGESGTGKELVARAVSQGQGQDQPIDLPHLPAALAEAPSGLQPGAPDRRPLRGDEVAHRNELIRLLREHRGNVAAVSRATGKGRQQIPRWLKRYALDLERFRGA
jgi:transcriptional regulator with GAF, ATPase, and Fis domain